MSLIKGLQIFKTIIQTCFMAGLIIPWLPHPEKIASWLLWTVPLVGVFFCGWVCPFGTAQDLCAWIAKKLKFPRFQISWRFQKYLQVSRYVWAGLILFAGVNYAFLSARYYFNDNLFYNALTWTSGLTLVFFLLAGLFIDRPFCNYFCMKGAVEGVMSIVRPFGIKRKKQDCIHCQLCNKICPMNVRVENMNFVRHPNCINCLKCVSVCPKKCIKFKLMTINLKGKQK